MPRIAVDLLIAVIMVGGIGGLVYLQKDMSSGEAGAGTTTSLATIEQVAAHNTRADCWTIINGGIYDLTSWIPKHPGGEQAILQLCGADGSAKFNGQHGGAATQAAILAGFKIGGSSTTTPSVSLPAAVDDDGTPDQGKNRRGGDDD